MIQGTIDHRKHGWALLALRIPGIRTLPISAHIAAEMAECYSIATLHIEKLSREQANASAITEYDELRASIEQEVVYYMTKQANALADSQGSSRPPAL